MHSKNESITRMKLLPHLLTKNNPEKVGDAPRQFVRICRSFILSFVLPLFSIPLTHSLSPTPRARSRGSYRQFSSSSSRASTPQRYSKHTQHSSPTLRICSHLSSVPPPPAPSPFALLLSTVGLVISESICCKISYGITSILL